MADFKEVLLTVPAELVRRSYGLALDFGSSTLKCIYRTKEDFDEVADEKKELGHLRIFTFGRESMKQGLDYVGQKSFLSADKDEYQTLYVTGVGCTENAVTISETLNTKLQVLTEFDSYVKSFFYLASRLSRDHLLEPFLDAATAEPLAYVHGMMAVMQNMQAAQTTQAIDTNVDVAQLLQGLSMAVGRPIPSTVATPDVPLAVAEPDSFPCILVSLGSGACFLRIEKDGSFKIVDTSNRSGKSLVGIGALLTGCKTFDEFIELASKGDSRGVDQYSNELLDATKTSSDEASDMYSQTMGAPPSLMFCFGKAAAQNAKLDELKREDKARAWLSYVLLDLVQCAHHVATINGVQRLFFCGGLCSNTLIREIMTTELARRNLAQMMFAKTAPIRFDFVQAGQHLGALGCLVNYVEKFL